MSSSSSATNGVPFFHRCPQCDQVYAGRGVNSSIQPPRIDRTPRRPECQHIRCANCLINQPSIGAATKKQRRKTKCEEAGCGRIIPKQPPHANEIMKTMRRNKVIQEQQMAATRTANKALREAANREAKRRKQSSAPVAPAVSPSASAPRPGLHFYDSSSSSSSSSAKPPAQSRPQPSDIFKAGWRADDLLKKIVPSHENYAKYQNAFMRVQADVHSCFSASKPPVEKVGSYGKNTMINGSDLDIVVRFSDIKTEDDYKRRVLQLFQFASSRGYIHPDYPNCNDWVVKCKVNGISVDILPAPIVPNLADHLAANGHETFLGACGSVGNRNFIQKKCGPTPSVYRDALQCVKYWVTLHDWPPLSQKVTQPKSFLLELIVLDVVSRAHRNISTTQIFADVLILLAQRERQLILHSDLHPTELNLLAMGSTILDGFRTNSIMTDEQFHVVVDPMNPHNDVSSKLRNASLLRKYATATLKNLGK